MMVGVIFGSFGASFLLHCIGVKKDRFSHETRVDCELTILCRYITFEDSKMLIFLWIRGEKKECKSYQCQYL